MKTPEFLPHKFLSFAREGYTHTEKVDLTVIPEVYNRGSLVRKNDWEFRGFGI
jgi:hypothetical protein